MNYTVSCSGDVTCPPNFTTTDNITRSYTITNLTTMTTYTFSVVATNSIGSGEAGITIITTPSRKINVVASNGNSKLAVSTKINQHAFLICAILIFILIIKVTFPISPAICIKTHGSELQSQMRQHACVSPHDHYTDIYVHVGQLRNSQML